MNNNTCYDITLYIVKPFNNKYPGIAWKRKQMAVADDRPFCEGRGVKIISWQQLIVFLMAKNMCKIFLQCQLIMWHKLRDNKNKNSNTTKRAMCSKYVGLYIPLLQRSKGEVSDPHLHIPSSVLDTLSLVHSKLSRVALRRECSWVEIVASPQLQRFE